MKHTVYNQKKKKLVLKDGRRNIGHLNLTDLQHPGAFITDFFVKEDHRNQGNGTHLFQAAEAMAKISNCEAISLYCYVENTDAVRFYRRQGMFIACVTSKEDCYIMTKPLNAN